MMLIEMRQQEPAALILQEAEKYEKTYHLYIARGKYHLLTGDLSQARQAATQAAQCSVNVFGQAQVQRLEAQIKAAAGDWHAAMLLQKKSLDFLDDSFSEIRIVLQDYARYCIMANEKAEAAKTIKQLDSIAPDHPEIVALKKLLSDR